MQLRPALLVLCTVILGIGAPRAAFGQLGGRPAAEWIKTLESSERLKGLKIAETVAALKLPPNGIVADIGAGTGVFSLPLARAVRPGGTLYAVEVDEHLIEHIMEQATEQGVANVQPVFAEYDDPLLPPSIDLAFIHDVLHHIEKREVYLKNLARSITPTGRIAVIEFIPGLAGHRDDPNMQISTDQAAALMNQAGFKPVEEIKLFDDKWFIIYGRQ
jgi:ubiquinone/menaquinone biosynthesis C-methylase UbiE